MSPFSILIVITSSQVFAVFLWHWHTVFAAEQPPLVLMAALKWDHRVHLTVEYLMICVIYFFVNCSRVN